MDGLDEQGFHGRAHFDELEDLHGVAERREHCTRRRGLPQPQVGTSDPIRHIRFDAFQMGHGAEGVGEGEVIAPKHHFLFAGPPFFSQGVRLAGEHHLPSMQEDDFVTEALHTGHVMGGQQNGGPIGGQFPDGIDDAAGVDGVEPAEGLIQNQQRRLVNDRADELDLLRHAFGDVGHLAVPPSIHFEPFEPPLQLGDGGRPLHALEPGEVDRLLAHFHVLVETPFLGEVTDAPDRFPRPRLTAKADDPRIGLHDAHDAADEGGLAGAIGAEQPHDAARLDRETDPFQDALGPVGLFQLRDLECVVHQLNMSRTRSKKPLSRGSGFGWKLGASRQLSKVLRSSADSSWGVQTLRFTSRSPRP